MAEEWYRSGAWDAPAREDFERRLRRSRSWTRPQYLRIKGLALRDAGHLDGARELWTRVLDEHPEGTDASSALEHLGDLARLQGQPDEAERRYRALLARDPSLNGTTHMVEVSLAEMLIERDDDQARPEATALLRSALDRHPAGMFNDQLFRWLVASATLSVQLGDVEFQQRAARRALELAQTGPQLPRHPTVGVVHADPPTLSWLRALATPDGIAPADRQPPWTRTSRSGPSRGETGGRVVGVRLGIAHHLGWAVVVTASADHEVVDRRRIDLIEPGVPTAPIHHEGGPHLLHRRAEPLDDDALAALVADVRASVVRAASAALDELATATPEPIVSMSLRAWPADFPEDIAVQRRVPYEGRADAVMYLQVLAQLARDRGWDVHLYDAKHVEEEAAGILGARADDVLHGPRATLGPPWSKDHRMALAATIVAT